MVLDLQLQRLHQDNGTISNDIINLPVNTCKTLLTDLSGVETRRLIAVLWDHGLLHSTTQDWPVSLALNLADCKTWMAVRTEVECWSMVCELQVDGLLEGERSGIEGAIPRYANLSLACAMNNEDPKHGSTQSSWARLRNNLKVNIESLNRTLNGARVSGHTVATKPRKTTRHKPYTKRKAARKLAAIKATSITAYVGPQLPLPSPSANPPETTLSTSASVNVLRPEQVPEWLSFELWQITTLRPSAVLVVVKKMGQEDLWIKCCDCNSYHETDEPVRSIRILEHLNSGDHLHNVNLRLAGQHGYRFES